MKPFAVLVLLFSSLVAASQQPAAGKSVAAPAAQPATAEDINRLIEIMHVKQQMTEMQRTILDQYKPMIEKMSADMLKAMTPQQRQRFNDIINDMMADTLKAYPPDDMLKDMLPIYQKYLDRSDVEAMIAFYSTPTGQKLLETQPKIAREFMTVLVPRMQERFQDAMQKMQDRLRDLVAETQSEPAQEKGSKPAAPAPSKK